MLDSIFQALKKPFFPTNDNTESPEYIIEKWKKKFELIMTKSEVKPKVLFSASQKGFKELVRGWTWCRLLRVESESDDNSRLFKANMMRIFGEMSPERFEAPCFGSPLNLENGNFSLDQIEQIKQILCIVGDLHPQLEFTFLIPACVCLLTKYLNSGDSLACMIAMIDGHSIPASLVDEWAYFPINRRDHLVFQRVFEDLIAFYVPKINRHVSKLSFENGNWSPQWKRILSTFLIGTLPRELTVRIFDSYIVEGHKTILRFALAHLILRENQLLQTLTGADFDEILLFPEMYSKWLVDIYFKVAFGSVKFENNLIQRYKHRRRKSSFDNFESKDRRLIVHRKFPILKSNSTFICGSDWEKIWSWIPNRYKLLDLELSYTTMDDGKHISNILHKCQGKEPLLLMIETVSGKVIGCYISKELTVQNGLSFYGTGETFLFSLKPTPQMYPWNIKSNSNAFICVSGSFIAFGAGDDFGLWFDSFLTMVASGCSKTFNNSPLIDKSVPEDLMIYCLEIWSFS